MKLFKWHKDLFRVVVISAFFLNTACSLLRIGDYERINRYSSNTQSLYEQGQYLEALQRIEKSLEAEKSGWKPELEYLAREHEWLAMQYIKKLSNDDKANEHFQAAFTIDRKFNQYDLVSFLTRTGNFYAELERYGKAIEYYQGALDIQRVRDWDMDAAKTLNSLGMAHQALSQYEQALNYFQEALTTYRDWGREKLISSNLALMGKIYHQLKQYNKAIKYYQEALVINRTLGWEKGVVFRLNDLGGIFYALSRYDQAIESFQDALVIARKRGFKENTAKNLTGIGLVYDAWGQYDKAIKHYQAALVIDKKLGREGEVAEHLDNIGGVYNAWGQYDKAIEYFRKALAIDRKLGLEEHASEHLNKIGSVYYSWHQYDEALVYYKEALAIGKKLEGDRAIASYLRNIGRVYLAWRQGDRAIEYYQQALTIDKGLGNRAGIASSFSKIGEVYDVRGQYDKAIAYYEQALLIDEELGREGEIASHLSNIGMAYYKFGNRQEAIPHFIKSITLKEKLRETATGSARRDYLASQIVTYQFLISSYIKEKRAQEAFTAIEISHARHLAEKLAEGDSEIKIVLHKLRHIWNDLEKSFVKFWSSERQNTPKDEALNSNHEIEIPSLADIQKDLSDKTAVLIYANTDQIDLGIAQIALTKKNIHVREITKESFVITAMKQYEKPIAILEKNQRGIKLVTLNQSDNRHDKDRSRGGKGDFEKIINYYRSLVGNISSDTRGLKLVGRNQRQHQKTIEDLSRLLYKLLIKPNEKALRGKEELIIVPEGLLAFIPFELLIDEEGRYLLEKYRITYTQSMGIYRQIQQRRYAKNRKSLLAFGGAVYDEIHYKTEMIDNAVQFASLQKNTHMAVNQQRSIRDTYNALGVGNWSNLPGTLNEVKEISKVVKKTTLFTGKEVTENRVKAMSENGELLQYKVIHFATHGLVLPAMPELSAVVLSQFSEEQGGEDGYLRMAEIAKLKIQADFVNLSACETGLGKIYNGEGVVGLTHAFLLAGAKGLSVSLWNVQDESTAQFMTAMYRLVEEKGFSYANAMTTIKRQFLKGNFGEEYKAPYYWAPFVYYGGDDSFEGEAGWLERFGGMLGFECFRGQCQTLEDWRRPALNE